MRDRLLQAAFIIFPIIIFGTLFVTIMDKKSPSNEKKVETTIADNVTPDASDDIDLSNLQVEDVTIGEGEEALEGSTVRVDYRGKLTDGTEFDNSYDRGEPLEFTIGAGQMIAGFDEGVKGMKVGGKRTITIPPELGYGDVAKGSIPANSTLVFEVELVEVVPAG